jgi:alpha-glucosidase
MSIDSRDSSYRYVRVDEFNPNSAEGWTSFGDVVQCLYDKGDAVFTLTGTPPGGAAVPPTGVVAPGPAVPAASAPVLKISILGSSAFRVRFNPTGDYGIDGSFAVVDKNLGTATITILQNDTEKLSVDLGGIRLDVLFHPFTVQVFRKDQLISTDTAQGLIYVAEGGSAVANFKNLPAHAFYFGAGEKGGTDLALNDAALTSFNYDNFQYNGQNSDDGNGVSGFKAVIPSSFPSGPLDWTEPLYNSIPFIIEDNPNPLTTDGVPTGVPYAYGILLDNESQTYMNFGASSSFNGNMYGKYYFGALYGEIDYYFMAGDDTREVLAQYKTLVGPAALAPMWALGNHQGCYGYYDQGKVIGAIQKYRAAAIPLDGMHIDVDFQNNYRTFTASELKFPGGGAPTFTAAAALGVKCSTNITGIVTIQPQDENGQSTPYPALDSGLAVNAFVQDNRAEGPGPAFPKPFVTNENYGINQGSNPYPSPNAPFNPGCGPGDTSLGTYGYYADLGQQAVRDWWGGLYKPLLDAGLEMVWQDMTDPATQPSVCDSAPFKTLPLNVLMFDYTQNKLVPSAEIHNVFALNLISATHTGLVKLRKEAGVDKRPFIIARGGFAGVHRYAASWTGDSASDWNFLAILIPEILNFGLSGQPMSGADVGGFANSLASDSANGTVGSYSVDRTNHTVQGGYTDPELMARWTTLSAFIGWCRNHYNGYTKEFQEPYAYPDPCQSACRKYIEIRYKLLQLFYDLLYQCTLTGLPICRPLFLTDRSDMNVYGSKHLNDQFMVGDDLLIAPIIQRFSVNRDVYLPAGSDWYPYQDAKEPLPSPNTGGQSFNWYAPLDLVPMYVRAGAILPRRELEQHVGQLPECPLTFECYPGPDRSYELYLDDKIGLGYQKGNFRLTTIAHQTITGTTPARKVTVTRTQDNFTPKETFFYISLLSGSLPSQLTLGAGTIPDLTGGGDQASSNALGASPVNAFYFSTSLQTVFIKVFDTAAVLAVTAFF